MPICQSFYNINAWYEKFATVVTSLGFISSHHDSALFVKHLSVGRILLSLSVDDMIITRDDSIGIESLKLELAHRFAMKDLGLLCYFLDKMVEDIPIDVKEKLTPTDGDPLPDPSLYQTLVSSLVYLTVTRLDISYAVHIKSKKQDVISKSSTKVEYRAMAVTTSKIVWLHWLLADMGVPMNHATPLHCDNRSAIQIARNSVFHERTKHIEIDYVFTKPCSRPRFRFLTDKLSMFLAAAFLIRLDAKKKRSSLSPTVAVVVVYVNIRFGFCLVSLLGLDLSFNLIWFALIWLTLVSMDTSKNVLKSDTSLFEQFQKFVDMYAKFKIILDLLEQHKKFLALHPHAMSTSYNKELTSSFFKWILDSGATHHMSNILLQFISLSLNSLKSIMAANGESMTLAGIGSIDTPSVSLSDVYYIPSLTMNLASVSKICDSGGDVNFSVSDCSIYDRETHEMVRTSHRQGYLYILDHFRNIHDTTSSSVDLSSIWLNRFSSTFYLWHSRLGYVSGSRLRFLASTGVLGDLETHDISDYSGCKLTKFLALPFTNNISSSTALFDIVHSDVWGPSLVSVKGGSKYYVSFIDDFTSYN
ncbi:gag-pol polyprotein [Tanacetum coccineum]